MPFTANPPGMGFLALRSPPTCWSPAQQDLIRTALQGHPHLPKTAKRCVMDALHGRPVRCLAAFRDLPSLLPSDPITRFAIGSILLPLVPLACKEDEIAHAIESFLEAVPYRLPGTCWLRVEQDICLSWHYGLQAMRSRERDCAQERLQMSSQRLLEGSFDTYQPAGARGVKPWLGVISRRNEIDERRKDKVRMRRFQPLDMQEVLARSDELHELHEYEQSPEDELIQTQTLGLVRQMAQADQALHSSHSWQMREKLVRALNTLSDHQLVILCCLLHSDCDDKQLAKLLDTTVGNVRKRRHDAKKKLAAGINPKKRRQR